MRGGELALTNYGPIVSCPFFPVKGQSTKIKDKNTKNLVDFDKIDAQSGQTAPVTGQTAPVTERL